MVSSCSSHKKQRITLFHKLLFGYIYAQGIHTKEYLFATNCLSYSLFPVNEALATSLGKYLLKNVPQVIFIFSQLYNIFLMIQFQHMV